LPNFICLTGKYFFAEAVGRNSSLPLITLNDVFYYLLLALIRNFPVLTTDGEQGKL